MLQLYIIISHFPFYSDLSQLNPSSSVYRLQLPKSMDPLLAPRVSYSLLLPLFSAVHSSSGCQVGPLKHCLG